MQSPVSMTYSPAFFRAQRTESLRSAHRVLSTLFEHYRPGSVLDVGCGVGPWLQTAKQLGIADIRGVDGDYVPRDQLMIPAETFSAHDLSQPLDLGRRFDLVTSLEVAEHLPQESAKTFVETLTRHGDLILFSAAVPYQGGTGHQNENWLEYWAHLFHEAGYEPLDLLRPLVWRDPDIAWWYRQNVMLFRAATAARRILANYESSKAISYIHPELLLRSVRRSPSEPIRSTQEEDATYFYALTDPLPIKYQRSYGPEFDFKVPSDFAFASYDELKRSSPEIGNPVLSDALAPIVVRTPPLPPLKPAKAPPYFLCIGVQKAATTWLYELFRSHKGLRSIAVKEVNFFNRRTFAEGSAYHHGGFRPRVANMLRNYMQKTKVPDAKWLRFLAHLYEARLDGDWYEQVFNFYANPKIPAGEITPEYAMLPESGIKEIRNFAPNIRLILMLRDPVDRVLSHLSMLSHQVPSTIPFLDLIAREASVLERSRFDQIVPRWRAHFDDRQLLIVTHDRLLAQPKASVVKIAEFLGVDVEGFGPGTLETLDQGTERPPIHKDTLDFLTEDLSEGRKVYVAFR